MAKSLTEILYIPQDDPRYPAILKTHLADRAPHSVAALGNIAILDSKPLALFSSMKCPGSIILKACDLVKRLRDAGVTVISGFHSPLERECLNILLKGKQPIIFCPARGLEKMQIKPEFRKPLDDGRLLILSPFKASANRTSTGLAEARNRFTAALGNSVFIPYAAPNGKTERFCKDVLAWGKPLYTVQDDANSRLIASGAKYIYHPGESELVENSRKCV